MMQIVEGLPDNVVGVLAKGRVTNEDCRKVLKPAMEHSLSRHDKIRLYYEISSRFPGAAWDDLRIGVSTCRSGSGSPSLPMSAGSGTPSTRSAF
jgi:hypothetical protein